MFSRISDERIVYAAELTEHITAHGGEAEYETGGSIGGLLPTWLYIKDVFNSRSDKAILAAITTAERASIAKKRRMHRQLCGPCRSHPTVEGTPRRHSRGMKR